MGNLIRRRGAESAAPSGGLYFTSPKKNIEFFSSGCALLDCVLGGGWPLGRIANIVGDKSTGKTLLAIEACANFLRKYRDGGVLYVEAEASFDKDYAAALGLPVERVTFAEDIGTVEGLFTKLGDFIGYDLTKDKEDRRKTTARDKPGLVVVDSLDALSDEAEAGRAIDQGSYGASKARKMSELFRRLVRELAKTRTCTMIISQVRDNIGITFGKKHTRSGGRALDFYASQALWLAHIRTLRKVVDKQDRAVGVTIKAKCEKNKISIPFRECELDVRFGYGIEDIGANLAFLDRVGKAKRVPALSVFKQSRGKELTELRRTLALVVEEEWYEFEKNFVSQQGKYHE